MLLSQRPIISLIELRTELLRPGDLVFALEGVWGLVLVVPLLPSLVLLVMLSLVSCLGSPFAVDGGGNLTFEFRDGRTRLIESLSPWVSRLASGAHESALEPLSRYRLSGWTKIKLRST